MLGAWFPSQMPRTTPSHVLSHCVKPAQCVGGGGVTARPAGQFVCRGCEQGSPSMELSMAVLCLQMALWGSEEFSQPWLSNMVCRSWEKPGTWPNVAFVKVGEESLVNQ